MTESESHPVLVPHHKGQLSTFHGCCFPGCFLPCVYRPLLKDPLYRWSNRGSEPLSTLPEFTEPSQGLQPSLSSTLFQPRKFHKAACSSRWGKDRRRGIPDVGPCHLRTFSLRQMDRKKTWSLGPLPSPRPSLSHSHSTQRLAQPLGHVGTSSRPHGRGRAGSRAARTL